MRLQIALGWILFCMVAFLLFACGAAVQTESVAPVEAPANTSAPPATATQAPVAEAATSTVVPVATPTPAPETCTDPFEGQQIRFQSAIWQADRLARTVREGIVAPDSGLATNFCRHSVDYSEILSGGPPPDGIPPIDNPDFESQAAGDDWLSDVSPVLALEINGEARAYPLAILTNHEIVNDEVGGIPVAVTFCPLCNAGIVFDRRVNGDVLRFGVSGNLRNSDLIMWDNVTLSWWQQFTGEAIVGDLTGTQLEMIPAQLVAWEDFKAAYPAGVVLSTRGRNYGFNPYVQYDSSSQPFLFEDAPDPRLAATERVLGYYSGDTAIAYPLPALADLRVVQEELDGRSVVIFYEPGQVSALDQRVIDESREVGSAAMFEAALAGQELTFHYRSGKIIDEETGSTWDVFGRAVDGELAGSRLQPVLSHVHFWFAWAAFRPDTQVFGD